MQLAQCEQNMMLIKNRLWVVSGVGILIFVRVGRLIFYLFRQKNAKFCLKNTILKSICKYFVNSLLFCFANVLKLWQCIIYHVFKVKIHTFF